MSRTIEVGRAVLSSSTQRLELWLTTLITISPSQQIDNQQLSSPALLRLLSSGNLWMGRGSGMLMQIELTLRGEPLPQERFSGLIENIMSAPVWAQLNLRATRATDINLDEKTTAININHCENASSSGETKRHRLFCDVPAADVQPSEGIPRFQLQVVRLAMDILEPKQRPRLKRSRTSPLEHSATESHAGHGLESDDDSDSMLHDIPATANNTSLGKVGDDLLPTNRRRKRQRTSAPTRTISSPATASTQEIGADIPTAMVNPQGIAPFPRLEDEMEEISLLVDAAMRLSIYGINKPYNGLKIKANTFGTGLADVSPALWRPGYLAALSQRAHLLPSISRSFGQASVTSVSLSEKIRRLTASSSKSAYDCQSMVNDGPSKRTTQSLSDQLWLHMQRGLLTKVATSLQACVGRNADAATQIDSDEILDHDRAEHAISGLEEFDMEDHASTYSVDHNTEQHVDISSHAIAALSVDQSEIQENLDPKRAENDMGKKGDALVEPSSAFAVYLAQDEGNICFDVPPQNCQNQDHPANGILARSSTENEYTRDLGIVAAAEGRLSNLNLHDLPGVAHAEQTLEEHLLFDGLDEDA